MANVLDTFKFTLHSTLEGLERDLVQHVQERLLKEGESFPGEDNRIEATVVVDLDAIRGTAASSRAIRQVQQTKG